LALSALVKRLDAVVTDAQAELDSIAVHYAPTRGWPKELVDRIPLAPVGELAYVAGVGRWLRMLRAARVRIEGDPYALCRDVERAAQLARRCIDTTVRLVVARRFERSLTLWTDSGVQHFGAVIDFTESADGLWIRRRGGGPMLHVARDTLIRFETGSQEHLEVVSVEGPRRCA
jgi:urease beta subunit